MKATLMNQLCVILWKNFRLRKRRPLQLATEILIPLFIIFILVAVRTAQLKFNIGRCELREKQMASMGPVPFLRDFICTFNTSCYNKTQIDWSSFKRENAQEFIANISDVYESVSQINVSEYNLKFWAYTHPGEVEKLRYSIRYAFSVFSPLVKAMQEIISDNQTDKTKGFTTLGESICGSNDSDFLIFIRNFNFNQKRRKKKSLKTCQMKLYQLFGNQSTSAQMYQVIAPLIFGKIFYSPDTQFSRQIVEKANKTFQILDNLRLMSVEWRLNFNSWFIGYMNNSNLITTLRSMCTEPMFKALCPFVNMTNIEMFAEGVSSIFSLIERALNCTELNKFVPMKSSSDIDNLSSKSLVNVFAGLNFKGQFEYLTRANATFLDYEIRMPTNRIDSTKKFKVLDNFWTPAPRIKTLVDFKYYMSGFLLLQEAVDQAFIELVTARPQPLEMGSSMQIMPYPCYMNDKFIRFLSNMMPFLLVIAWSPSVIHLIKCIVYEKEHRLKEFMRVMGLTNLVHWIGWFISIIVVLILPIILMAVIMKYNEILPFSSPIVVFLVLLFYVISCICQAFMISVFFDKANIAAVTGGILYFLFYMPFTIFIKIQDDLTSTAYYLGGLLTQVAFANSVNFIAYWEQSNEGAQFSNLFESSIFNLNFGVGHSLIMMAIDSVIYLLITWYVETVFPGEFGVGKPWYFLFTKHYWCPEATNKGYNEIDPVEIENTKVDSPGTANRNSNNISNLNSFEAEPNNLNIGISIRNLVKFYPKAKIPAVNDLNLNFYQSQITAFLGHNGAGKTTTISILTGIFSPTSGTALILDDDIRRDMDKIRKKMGLCPQHNILFGDLTVEDHIYFYGQLKGMKKTEIKESLPKIVEDVGLTKKINAASKKLSGGMKRKLSVALAFIGNSKIVFLDEPTAGVDPFARRGIWDLLIKYRSDDRTIILTTHHMDEADYLSDRIAIISQGQLQCCGSSVFLKKLYGEGYFLILVKNERVQEEGFTNGISSSGEKVLKFVQNYIRNAKMTEETRTQWSIVLPQNEKNSVMFPSLFDGLDKFLDNLNIVSYGLSDTSLEEVFLKVAEDPSGEVDNIRHQKLTTDNVDSLTDDGDLPRPSTTLSLKYKSDSTQINNISSVTFEVSKNNQLLTRHRLLWQQMLGLQIKRFHHTKRNIKGFLAELVLPVLMILLIISLLQLTKPFDNEPPMVISPWLMMPKSREANLHTFYRKENITNSLIDDLVTGYRSDLGESGVRCMNSSIYQLESFKCHPKNKGNEWSPNPSGIIPLQTPECDCSKTGNQVCSNPNSGGPPYSSRLMESSDILGNLTGYNISDHLMKRFKTYIKKQYGGFQLLLPSNFGQSSKMIANSPIIEGIKSAVNNSNSEPQKFVTYLQNFFNLSGIKTNFTRIWINSKGYASMPAYANIFSNLLLRSQLNSSEDPNNYGISVTNYPFKYSRIDLENKLFVEMFLELSLAVFVIFGLSFIPASFVIFLIEERVCGAKRQQFVSGVNPYVYWVSNFMWDIVKYIIPIFIVILIFVAFNYQSYIGPKNVGAFIILLIFYGFAIIPHMYPFSFILSTPSTAFVILDAYNLLVGSVTTVSTFLLDLLEEDDDSLKAVNNILKKVFLVFPQYDLGRGMMELSVNYLQYNMSGGMKKYNAFDWNVVSEKLCALFILFCFWWAVLCLMESGLINRLLLGRLKNYSLKGKEVIYEEDDDVMVERKRIVSNLNDRDVLKVINLTKIYNPSLNCKCKYFRKTFGFNLFDEKRKLAVNNICFGVKEGECFGLLGVNGAGKTTTFKMLTGEEDITHGNALINGNSIIDNMISAHKNMGFCPQFDALHSLLTCEELLYFYCRIRGIKPSEIQSTVETSLKNLSLIPHSHKTSHTLSGGNKRKLSTAIALIGYPKTIFLDEPTSGMDAGARRFLWNIIQKLTSEMNIAVILTSHNMEECEVLCHRLSIMVNGELKCIGSVQHIKSKFGDNYYVKVRLHTGKNQKDNRANIKKTIQNKFGEKITLKDENFVTLQYQFDTSFKLSAIFEFFENLKRSNEILDYSVSQTTLDDVFINFAKKDLAENPGSNIFNNSVIHVDGLNNESFENESVDSGVNV